LKIRLFTPAAAPFFTFIATDLGRPLADFTIRFTGLNLIADARAVLTDHTPVQRETQSASGGWYLCGISPYRAQDDRLMGS